MGIFIKILDDIKASHKYAKFAYIDSADIMNVNGKLNFGRGFKYKHKNAIRLTQLCFAK